MAMFDLGAVKVIRARFSTKCAGTFEQKSEFSKFFLFISK